MTDTCPSPLQSIDFPPLLDATYYEAFFGTRLPVGLKISPLFQLPRWYTRPSDAVPQGNNALT